MTDQTTSSRRASAVHTVARVDSSSGRSPRGGPVGGAPANGAAPAGAGDREARSEGGRRHIRGWLAERLPGGPRGGVKGSGKTPPEGWRRGATPRIAALLAYAIGLLDIVSAVTPPGHGRVVELRSVLPGYIPEHARTLTVLVGVLLILLAHGLARRKRRAWQLVLALTAASTVLHVLKGLDYDDATGSAIFGLWLVYRYRDFHAEPDPSSRWRALGALTALFTMSLLTGIAMLRIGWARHLIGHYPLSEQLEHVVLGLVGAHGPVSIPSPRADRVVSRTLAGMGLLTAAVPTWMALRPAHPFPRHNTDDEAGLIALLARHGADDSLGWFALRRDKAVIWSPSGKSAIAYRVLSGVMLASGDPIGDREAWPGAIAEFLRVAASHAWVPAVIGCSAHGGTAWTRAGLTALELGDEAVLSVEEFSLEGRPMRGVRQAVARVERAGYTAAARRLKDVPAAERAALRRMARTWRGSEPERGFSMALGRFSEDSADPEAPDQVAPWAAECVLVTASSRAEPADTTEAGPAAGASPDQATAPGPATTSAKTMTEPGAGEPRGMLLFVPWGRDGMSLDLMLRDPQADNGVTELLIVAAVRSGKELGIRRISLNFAAFRQLLEHGGRLGAGPVARGTKWLLVFMSRWFQIESLYRFNSRFRPAWEPRYVCFPTNRDLPRVAVAMAEAEAFLTKPWRRSKGPQQAPDDE
ncbi:phosphatidylglycerol lysyltransferase domain-containing protein [Pseudofrankia sp. DC12]|uniref:phosphatidylglycerol lysyltransferase domain-containing protein n=1 Tax=Pseudofrankia sp. DC12 TaxID=683315 RepID=UPI0009FC9C3B|nr:phosphatidylglycerol lysyltransferase domain-containing protein [Pseudofrankia sp. DC12]